MAFGDSKRDLVVAENAGLKKEVEMLREFREQQQQEIADLKATLIKTQDALIAKESPHAYFDQRDAKMAAEAEDLTEEQKEGLKKFHEEQKLLDQYARDVEGPMFKDAEDLQAKLLGVLLKPESESLHDDGES